MSADWLSKRSGLTSLCHHNWPQSCSRSRLIGMIEEDATRICKPWVPEIYVIQVKNARELTRLRVRYIHLTLLGLACSSCWRLTSHLLTPALCRNPSANPCIVQELDQLLSHRMKLCYPACLLIVVAMLFVLALQKPTFTPEAPSATHVRLSSEF